MCYYGKKKKKITIRKTYDFCPEGRPEKSATGHRTVYTGRLESLYTRYALFVRAQRSIRPSLRLRRRLLLAMFTRCKVYGSERTRRRTGLFFIHFPTKNASCRIRFRSISHEKPATRNTTKRFPSARSKSRAEGAVECDRFSKIV